MYSPIRDVEPRNLELSSMRGQNVRSPHVEVHLPVNLSEGEPEGSSWTVLSSKRKVLGGFFGAALVFAFLFSGFLGNTEQPKLDAGEHGYGQADFIGDRVVLHNYDSSKVFSSFLPGIGGEYGIPMWAFYVSTLNFSSL